MGKAREGYKQTKVGVIPEDWKVVKLGDVANVTMGQSPSSNSYNENKIGIPLIQGNADCKNRKTFPRTYTTEKTKECFIDDIIMTVRAPVGAISKSFHNACIGRGVCAIKSKRDNDFLYHYLVNYEQKWNKYSQGSTFTAVNSRDVKNLKIPLPPLKEQQKIAQILSTWDDAISKQEELIVAKEQLKIGLMQRLLSGEVRFAGFDGEWEEVRLCNIGNIIRGVSYKPDDLSLADNTETIRLMRSNNIQVGYLDIQKELQYVDKLKVKESQKLQLGDLVICMANGSKKLVGKNSDYAIEDNYIYTVGAFCAIFRFKKNIVNSFFRYLFQTDKYNYYVQNLLAGSNINNLKGSDIESMKFIIPNDKEEQQKIAQVLTIADKEIELLKQELEVLKEQKHGLMQKLLTGEVRVVE
ncbi:MAG: restriction endonuclease subunit S [Sulfurovum sp.]|nr:restriction endonuclease subunit S [Sulfurovum sp.]